MAATMDDIICEDLCALEQPETSTNNTVRLTKQELMPIVTKSFQRFGGLHWSMLAAGAPDACTLAALTDVVTDIIQALSAETIRVALRIAEQVKAGFPAGRGNFTVSLGDDFSASIAWALSMPEEKCPSVEALREMVEKEVSEKVNSAVSLAMNSPALPPEPVIYVSGSKSRIGNLRRMVHHAAACLKRYAAKMCPGQLEEDHSVPPSPIYTPESQQASSEMAETKAEERQSFFKVARRQFDKMTADLKSTFKKKDPEFLVDLRQESAQSPTSTEAPESPRLRSTPTPSELVAARKLQTPMDFKCIKSGLHKMFLGSHKAGILTSEMLENIMSSGEIQKFSRALTYKMYDHLMVGPYEIPVTPLGNCLSDSILSKTRREVGQSHVHFSPEVLYAMTEDAVGKFLQSLLLCKEERLDALSDEGRLADTEVLSHKTVTPPAEIRIKEPDVPAVGQKPTPRLAFVNSAPCPSAAFPKSISSQELSCEHRVASAPVRLVTASQVVSRVSATEKESEQRTSSSSLKTTTNLVASPAAEDKKSAQVVTHKKWTLKQNLVRPASCPVAPDTSKPISREEMSFEQRVASVPVHLFMASQFVSSVSSTDKTSEPEKMTDLMASPKPEAQRSDVPPQKSQEVTDAISALLLKVITESLRKCKKQVTVEDFQVVLTRLSKLPLDDINVSSDRIKKKSEKICNGMVKDLLRAFGSKEELLEAAMIPEDPSFEDTFMEVLKIHLKVIPDPTPKKGRLSRMLSAVGRAIMRPFKGCI